MTHDSPVVEEKEASPDHTAKTKLNRRDIIAIVVLIALLPALTIAIIPNQQIFNAYLVWAEDHVNLPVLPFYGKQMPTTWLITLDSIVSVSFLFLVVIFWRRWSKRFREPAEITKITIGSLIAAGWSGLFVVFDKNRDNAGFQPVFRILCGSI